MESEEKDILMKLYQIDFTDVIVIRNAFNDCKIILSGTCLSRFLKTRMTAEISCCKSVESHGQQGHRTENLIAFVTYHSGKYRVTRHALNHLVNQHCYLHVKLIVSFNQIGLICELLTLTLSYETLLFHEEYNNQMLLIIQACPKFKTLSCYQHEELNNIITCCPWSHGLRPKNFQLMWRCHQLMSRFLAKAICPECYLTHVCQLMLRVIMI